MKKQTFLTLRIYHNDKLQKEFVDQKTDFAAFKYMLDHQSCSIDHAIKYEGWKVEIKDQYTGEISYYENY